MSEHLLLLGDALEQLKILEDNSIDSLVTDPPAGISFMAKAWDDDKGGRKQWIEWMSSVMKEALRVLKPGAHGLVWAIPRTSHWTATALEDAGFEIRDVVTHLFGTGFPKSMNLGEGRGTALKPASEHWILVRKPTTEKTVAANVLKHGTGGINIDASRIGTEVRQNAQKDTASWSGNNWSGKPQKSTGQYKEVTGRFPANLILSHNPDCVEVGSKEIKTDSHMADKVIGFGSRQYNGKENEPIRKYTEVVAVFECTDDCAVAMLDEQSGHSVSGGASRFFYVAKASKKDKGIINTHPTVKSRSLMTYLIKLITPPNGIVLDPFMGSGSTGVAAKETGFNFIGIEKEKEYFDIAESRINDIKEAA